MTAGLLESARNLLAGILDLGRTRFELFTIDNALAYGQYTPAS